MKISPIDIRQHTFEKGFRGYNVDEVNAFLNSLSQEWERVMNESKMLKMQLEIAEKELNKLKDVEMTLFRTLKTAEDTSNQITEQANKAAEKYLQESRQKTDETIADARRKASMMVQDAENEARYIREEIINELKNQERDFKAMEKYRDNLVVQLKSLANNTSETVERFEKKFSKDSSFARRMEEIKQQVAEGGNRSKGESQSAEPDELPEAVSEPESAEETAHEAIATTGQEQPGEVRDETEKAEEPATGAITQQADEPGPEHGEPDDEEKVPGDAASEALAEVQKMALARKQAQELDAEKVPQPEGAPEGSSKGKGSFFDQIG